ncbi:MAG TPA: RagB/SusD family nutrient uptake outer membrane protein [Prolixibacteraceae bacterium]|nr:RagB/SusD family nutrient uptake outer membrane protein [Prolixibacteraceae bacterium]
MKKYIILFALIFSFSACKDFLEEKTVTTLTQDFYKTADGLESLVKGSYQILRFKPDYNQGHYLFGTCSDVEVFSWSLADRISMGTYAIDGWGPAATGTRMTPNVTSLIGSTSGGVSEGVYPEVSRCNIFLENYINLDASTQTKLAARKGEILFLRTYAYYLITNVVGDAPLILKSYAGMPENFNFPKTSMEIIYKQIISDLRLAVTLLPATSTELGRITKPAAAHLLAKLYLHRAQAAKWSGAETHLKMLYKGNVSTDLDSAKHFATMVIDQMKGNTTSDGLEPNFATLWKNATGDYTRDKSKEIILSAQYEPTLTYNGRYGNNLIHLYNSNHTSLRACTPRTMDYGRPYATAGPSDWGIDMYPDRANDSRYYKTFLTDYYATDAKETGGKPWDANTAYYYNNRLKPPTEPAVVVSSASKIKYQKRSIVYIENSKDQPMDSLWVNSQPYIMMVRWTVGSPNGAGYFIKNGSTIVGFKPGADVDPSNPVITNTAGRKLMYRVSCDKSEPFGLDRGNAVAQWYLGPRKWLDINRGKGTDVNGPGAIDFPVFRLAETYLIRAEVHGRQGNYSSAIADLNVLRKRASYHVGENRSDVLVNIEPAVITGKLTIPPAEKVAPYTVKTDSYPVIAIDGTEWQSGSARAKLENYPPTVMSEQDMFIHFVYNERARELIFELTTTEDLHNAGILYERVYYRDNMGAPVSATGTANFPFPVDDISTGSVGARGVGKGQLQKYNTFKAWPQSFIELLTDENGNAMSAEAKAAYQNSGY